MASENFPKTKFREKHHSLQHTHIVYFAAKEADAKPWLAYGGYYGYPYAYAGYAGYPYAYHYLGKRSADAEPEADAKPWYGYRGYGGYYGGYRGYGYRGYYWG